VSLQYGLRFSAFQNIGPGTTYSYDRSDPDEYRPLDTLSRERGAIFHTFTALEPRLALRWQLDAANSFKASYNRTVQYVHLATNTMSPTPLDVWFPSGPNVEPQRADQVAVGFFRNWNDDLVESSIELYYKDMSNVMDFKDHANIIANRFFEGEVRPTEAYSYGLELLVRKNAGMFSGWVSYTWSKTMMQSPFINNGDPYPAPYDRRHNLALVGMYDLTPRLHLGATWVYLTGAARTLPTGRFEYGGWVTPIYSERNSVRLPDYHRLDLSLTLDGKKPHERGKLRTGVFRDLQGSWNLSVYNVYNRFNAYSIQFAANAEDPYIMEAEKFFLFKIFPAITYNFKF